MLLTVSWKVLAEFCVPIVEQVAVVLEKSPAFRSRVASYLFHPSCIRMLGDAGNRNTASVEMDEEQYMKNNS